MTSVLQKTKLKSCCQMALLKVSKSQKHFFKNSIAQKINKILDKILPYNLELVKLKK